MNTTGEHNRTAGTQRDLFFLCSQSSHRELFRRERDRGERNNEAMRKMNVNTYKNYGKGIYRGGAFFAEQGVPERAEVSVLEVRDRSE